MFHGSGSLLLHGTTPLLSHMLNLMCDSIGAEGGILGLRTGHVIDPIAGFNTTTQVLSRPIDAARYPVRSFYDVCTFDEHEKLLQSCNPHVPLWDKNITFAIRLPNQDNHITVIMGRSGKKNFAENSEFHSKINLFRQIFQEEFRLIGDLSRSLAAPPDNNTHDLPCQIVREDRAPFRAGHAAGTPCPDEAADASRAGFEPTADFLFETLVPNRSLKMRGDISYYSLRRWRSPIKRFQLAAIKALKRNIPESFVDRIAMEMHSWVLETFGTSMFDTLVAVPCGHSGPGCLSQKIGARLARLLDIPFDEAFRPIPVSGSSHPRTNATRPRMDLTHQVKGRLLLIDDVATSGSHIAEATRLLRRDALSVAALAWISDA